MPRTHPVWIEGEVAYDEGKTIDDCPYDPNSNDGHMWLNGHSFQSTMAFCLAA